MLLWIVLVLLIVLLIGSLPRWPYSMQWGNIPAIVVGVVIAILLVYLLTGILPHRL